MGFFSNGGSNKYLRNAAVESRANMEKSLADLTNYGNQGIGTYQGLADMLRPGMDSYLGYALSGGGSDRLTSLADEMYNYRGPQMQDDPYLNYMNDATRRNTRMAQAARGGLGLYSSAGIGQEERALAQNEGEAFRYARENDINRMLNSYNMYNTADQTRGSLLGGIGSLYGNTIGNIGNLQMGLGQNLASMRQGYNGLTTGFIGNQQNSGMSFIDKFMKGWQPIDQVVRTGKTFAEGFESMGNGIGGFMSLGMGG